MGLLDLISARNPGEARQTLADLVRGPQNRLRGLLDDPAGFMGSALREGLGADDMERRWAWNQNRLDAMTGSDYTRASVDDSANRAALNLGLMGIVHGAGGMSKALNAKHPGNNIEAYLMEPASGPVTLSKVVVPKELRGGGIGSQFMQDLSDMADQSGRVVALSPSADFGGSKAKLIDFYKKFGFVMNKGKNKDFAISESMYRLPR